MRKVKTLRTMKGSRDLKTHPTTTGEVVNTAVPPRTVRNIPRGHMSLGMREIIHLEWEPWEQAVANALHIIENQRLDRANRFYLALEHAKVLVKVVQERGETAEKARAYSQSMMDTMSDILMTTDPGGIITEVNQATERISGYRREELIGQPFRQFFSKPDRALAGIEQTIQGGEVSDHELTVAAKDGRQVVVSYSAAVLRDPAGAITGVLGSARDVTERKRADEARLRLAAIVDSSDDAIVAKTLDGIILSWNAGAERLYGYSAGEVKGQSISILVPPDRHDEMSQLLEKAGQGETVRRLETVWIRKDGLPIHVSLSVSPIKNAEGQVMGAATISRDLSEREQAEEAIKATNRDLQTLLHVISHDLREPLRAIENFSRMVNEQYAEQLDEKGQDYFRRIILGAERMGRLINDITALSRAQQIEVPQVEIEGRVIVHKALERLETKIQSTKAQVQVAEDLPRFQADKAWAIEAVYNLVANALKFTREGEAPEIDIAPYQPAEGEPVGKGIVVLDRGPGVEPESGERIFQLFQRNVGREVEGTGSGLAIVRQVARRHGGSAWVRPRVGGGSEFIITFGTGESVGGEK